VLQEARTIMLTDDQIREIFVDLGHWLVAEQKRRIIGGHTIVVDGSELRAKAEELLQEANEERAAWARGGFNEGVRWMTPIGGRSRSRRWWPR
jgi:hypothetical protein